MTTAPAAARAQFSIERTYAASIDEAWALWTTKSGIESWWGPEGFDVTVTSLDLRPGGESDLSDDRRGARAGGVHEAGGHAADK